MKAAAKSSVRADVTPGGHLTKSEREAIRALIGVGLSHSQVALRIGRGKATISNAAKKMGLTPAQAKRPWTVEEDARLIHLENEGLTRDEIQKALGRGYQAVAYRLCYLRKHTADKRRYQTLREPTKPAPEPEQDQAPPAHRIAVAIDADTIAQALGLEQETDLYSLWRRANDRVSQTL